MKKPLLVIPKIFSKGIFVLFFCLALIGCSRTVPIWQVNNVLVPSALTQGQVKQSILKGCADKGWYAVEKEPGLIVASLDYRGFTVTTNIPYTNRAYSINYVTSTRLHAGNGKISRYYTRWVKFLDRKIKENLQTMEMTGKLASSGK